MITQDYINGYIQALNTIHDFLDSTRQEVDGALKSGMVDPMEALHMEAAYKSIQDQINDIKNSYARLIKEHNESQIQKN